MDGSGENGTVREPRESMGSFSGFLLLVLSAEVLFAVLVRLVLGTPPAGVTTVTFGLLMAVGLGLQHRSTVARRTARPERRGGPWSTRH